MDPQFARDLNETSRILCSKNLMTLGPWARAIWAITGGALKSNELRGDNFIKGADFMQDPLKSFNKTFLVYSGTLLKDN